MVLEKTHKITLYNDDNHSFLEVQSCLIDICKHDILQAAQCVLIVDGVGKYDIKKGSFEEMFELLGSLEEVGLTVKLHTNESNLY
jgi:ATP-dependent Clp protease adaptor protein ClpS